MSTDLKSMAGPGQEALLEEFLAGNEGDDNISDGPLGQFLDQQEAPAEPEADGLPEKYKGKSAAEVYRLTMQEAEYRAKQQGQEAPAPEIPEFTRDQSVADYGEALTGAFEKAEVNPYEIDAKVRAGQEVDADTISRLVAATGYPQPIVESYINSFRPAPPATQGQPLDEAAKAQLVAAAGGGERIAKVNAWVMEYGEQTEVDAFNSLVDSGNSAAALSLLKGFAARYDAATSREPQLLAGGTPSSRDGGMVFEDEDEAVAAMAKTDGKGKKLYNTDPVYRKQVNAAMARSKVFV